MHRIDTVTAQKDKFGAGKNGFTRGNPQTGTPATDLDDDYFDMLQEELCAVVEESGEELDKGKHNQLLTALRALLLSRSNPFGDIKQDGAEAIATALSNLGLGTAAKRDVGNGDDELPITSQVKLKSWVSAGRTLVDNTPLIINHGLTIDPDLCVLNIRLRCVIANNGYAVGDYAVGFAPRFLVGNTSAMTGNIGAFLTATQAQFNCGQSGLTVMSKSSGTPFGVSGSEHSNWAFEFHIIYQ